MEDKLRDLELKFLSIATLKNKSKTFQSLNEIIRKYLNELGRLRDKIDVINARIMNYDIIDFLSEKTAEGDHSRDSGVQSGVHNAGYQHSVFTIQG